MSWFTKVCGVGAVLFSFAVPAAAQGQSSPVKAVVRFVPDVSPNQRVEAVQGAGGRVVRVRPNAVIARMSPGSADALRTAMGVASVTIRR